MPCVTWVPHPLRDDGLRRSGKIGLLPIRHRNTEKDRLIVRATIRSAMNGKGLIIAVISVGVSLGILTATLGGFIISGQRSTSRDIASVRSELTEVRKDIGDLRGRMARLEGRMDTLESVIVQVFTKGEKR